MYSSGQNKHVYVLLPTQCQCWAAMIVKKNSISVDAPWVCLKSYLIFPTFKNWYWKEIRNERRNWRKSTRWDKLCTQRKLTEEEPIRDWRVEEKEEERTRHSKGEIGDTPKTETVKEIDVEGEIQQTEKR